MLALHQLIKSTDTGCCHAARLQEDPATAQDLSGCGEVRQMNTKGKAAEVSLGQHGQHYCCPNPACGACLVDTDWEFEQLMGESL